MKKPCIALAAVIAVSLVSCGSSNKESSVKEVTGVYDGELIGSWYNEDIDAEFNFSNDGVFSLLVDVSSVMTIDKNGVAHIPDSDEDYSEFCSYDGTMFSFVVEGGLDMLTMERKGEPDTESAYGRYVMLSGLLFEQFSGSDDDANGRYYIDVMEDKLVTEVEMCRYVSDEDTVILSGDGLSFFTDEEAADSRFSYKISNGKLTMKSDEQTLIFTRS